MIKTPISLNALIDPKPKANTVEKLLGLLRLKGKPYSLEERRPMWPLFGVEVPRNMVWKCARQISKSTSLAASSVLQSITTPFLQTLVVTPRHDQARRISTMSVKPFIETAVIRPLFTNDSCTNAVLQKDFPNGSSIFFSYAFLSPDRVRGYAVDKIVYDEVQDLSYDFIPIIHECMSASPYRIEQYSGTPKTLDNGIQALWEQSSQAEWVTKCDHCGYWNTATINMDLEKMIGLSGVVCAKCQKAIEPQTGEWKHTEPDLTPYFSGYHVPQIILPMHYKDPARWRELLIKRDGGMNYTQSRFLNEVLGESCDIGTKLITLTELKNACTENPNTYAHARQRVRQFSARVMGIDWGGGGMSQMSFTTIAIMGIHPVTNKLECIYSKRLHAAVSHLDEVLEILELAKAFQVSVIAHDYGGSGSARETLLIQAGYEVSKLFPMLYTRSSAKDLLTYHAPSALSSRAYYSVDKARSIILTVSAIKTDFVRFTSYDSTQTLLSDFLSLIEDKHDMPSGSDVYYIRRNPTTPDDFAHSVNFACCALWYMFEYPNIGWELERRRARAFV